MAVVTEGLNLGDLLKYEAPQLYSRDAVVVLAGQTLVLGDVVGLVTATGKAKRLDPAATDGSQQAAGIALRAIEPTGTDRVDGLLLARHAVVADHAMAWPPAITAPQKTAALQHLKVLGILVRKGI